MREQEAGRAIESGFTLVELLIAIVVVGILSAVAIIGVGGLVKNGSDSACQASMDAAKAASTVHYANTGNYPQNLDEMIDADPQELDVPAGVAQDETTLKKGADWTMTLTPHGTANQTTYACS